MTLKAFVVLNDQACGAEATTRILQDYVKTETTASEISEDHRVSGHPSQDRYREDLTGKRC